jgi:hypothetical protein
VASSPPTDAELDVAIRARLASIGIDLDQLPANQSDPATGTPSQAAVLSALRSFIRGTVATLAAFQLPAPEGTGAADAAALSQQRAPMLYPSISTAWRDS